MTAASFSAHSRYTTLLFALSFLAVLLPLMPSILLILVTRKSPPPLASKGKAYYHLAKAVSVAGYMGMFISSGLIRRRPEMRFDPPKLGAGFGLRAGVYDDAETTVGRSSPDDDDFSTGRNASKGDVRRKANVLDYDGCCLFSFIFVGYVSFSRYELIAQVS